MLQTPSMPRIEHLALHPCIDEVRKCLAVFLRECHTGMQPHVRHDFHEVEAPMRRVDRQRAHLITCFRSAMVLHRRAKVNQGIGESDPAHRLDVGHGAFSARTRQQLTDQSRGVFGAEVLGEHGREQHDVLYLSRHIRAARRRLPESPGIGHHHAMVTWCQGPCETTRD